MLRLFGDRSAAASVPTSASTMPTPSAPTKEAAERAMVALATQESSAQAESAGTSVLPPPPAFSVPSEGMPVMHLETGSISVDELCRYISRNSSVLRQVKIDRSDFTNKDWMRVFSALTYVQNLEALVLPSIKALDFQKDGLQVNIFTILYHLLTFGRQIEKLDLSHCDIHHFSSEDNVMSLLIDFIKRGQLTELNLSGNPLSKSIHYPGSDVMYDFDPEMLMTTIMESKTLEVVGLTGTGIRFNDFKDLRRNNDKPLIISYTGDDGEEALYQVPTAGQAQQEAMDVQLYVAPPVIQHAPALHYVQHEDLTNFSNPAHPWFYASAPPLPVAARAPVMMDLTEDDADSEIDDMDAFREQMQGMERITQQPALANPELMAEDDVDSEIDDMDAFRLEMQIQEFERLLQTGVLNVPANAPCAPVAPAHAAAAAPPPNTRPRLTRLPAS